MTKIKKDNNLNLYHQKDGISQQLAAHNIVRLRNERAGKEKSQCIKPNKSICMSSKV